MENILARRSIRKYTPEPVSEEMTTKILRAAMAAPSSGNGQPWHFIVIRNRETLDQFPEFHPYATAMKSASLAIVICGDLHLEKNPGRWMLDCAAATQNILIAVQALGLGAVWLGIYPDEQRMKNTAELLHLPEGVLPLCLVPIGYPAEFKPPADRFKEERIHHDQW